ncbi:MAG: DUF3772 domain-containing protein, partial [Dokdonella sp.]
MRIPVPLLGLLLALCVTGARAGSTDAAGFFDQARQQLADLNQQLAAGDLDAGRLDALRAQNNELVERAQALIQERTPALAALDARIDELGPLPEQGSREAADIGARRRELERERSAIDADIKRARLVIVDTSQFAAELVQARRTNFLGHLTQRTASPLTPTFWRDLAGTFDRDRAALAALVAQA